MIHYYTQKKYDRLAYKLLCTKEWVQDERGDMPYSVRKTLPMAVTAPVQVTCLQCLDLLIPKHEEILKTMLANRAKQKEAGANL